MVDSISRWSDPSLDQAIPIDHGLDQHFISRDQIQKQMRGQALPASIVSIDATGTIAVVKFEVLEPGTSDEMKLMHPLYVRQFPQMEMPVATDLYGIPPLKKGDKGYCLPGDYDLGAVSGYWDGPTSLTKEPNLSTLVFHPIGNVKANGRVFADKYYLSGPTGAHFRILSDSSPVATDVVVGPTPDGPNNIMQLNTLVFATSDAEAREKGIPLNGLYHNNGVVHVQWTIP